MTHRAPLRPFALLRPRTPRCRGPSPVRTRRGRLSGDRDLQLGAALPQPRAREFRRLPRRVPVLVAAALGRRALPRDAPAGLRPARPPASGAAVLLRPGRLLRAAAGRCLRGDRRLRTLTCDLRNVTPAQAAVEIDDHVTERRFHGYDFDQAPLYLFRAHVCPTPSSWSSASTTRSWTAGAWPPWSASCCRTTCTWPARASSRSGRGPPLPRPLRARRAGGAASDERSAVLAGHPAAPSRSSSPALRPHDAPYRHGLITLRVELPNGLEERARALARAHVAAAEIGAARCPLPDAAAVSSGATDITTGLVTGGRPERSDAERVTGLFLNACRAAAARQPAQLAGRGARALRRRSGQPCPPPLPAERDPGGPRWPTVLDTAFNYVHLRVLSEPCSSCRRRADSTFRTWEETNFRLLLQRRRRPGRQPPAGCGWTSTVGPSAGLRANSSPPVTCASCSA